MRTKYGIQCILSTKNSSNPLYVGNRYCEKRIFHINKNHTSTNDDNYEWKCSNIIQIEVPTKKLSICNLTIEVIFSCVIIIMIIRNVK